MFLCSRLYTFQSYSFLFPKFNKSGGNHVEECKLKVVYVSPPRKPSPVPEDSEEGTSPGASETVRWQSKLVFHSLFLHLLYSIRIHHLLLIHLFIMVGTYISCKWFNFCLSQDLQEHSESQDNSTKVCYEGHLKHWRSETVKSLDIASGRNILHLSCKCRVPSGLNGFNWWSQPVKMRLGTP